MKFVRVKGEPEMKWHNSRATRILPGLWWLRQAHSWGDCEKGSDKEVKKLIEMKCYIWTRNVHTRVIRVW